MESWPKECKVELNCTVLDTFQPCGSWGPSCHCYKQEAFLFLTGLICRFHNKHRDKQILKLSVFDAEECLSQNSFRRCFSRNRSAPQRHFVLWRRTKIIIFASYHLSLVQTLGGSRALSHLIDLLHLGQCLCNHTSTNRSAHPLIAIVLHRLSLCPATRLAFPPPASFYVLPALSKHQISHV